MIANGKVILSHLAPYAVLNDTKLDGENIGDMVWSIVEVAAPEVRWDTKGMLWFNRGIIRLISYYVYLIICWVYLKCECDFCIMVCVIE